MIFSAEAAVVFFFALSILLFLSNFGLCGTVGAFLKRLQTGLFGIPGYILPVFIVSAGVYGIANQENPRALVKIPAAFFLLITAGLWLPLLCCYQIIYPRLDETFQIEKKISSKKEQSSRKQKA